jgi:hypothetical protein
MRKKFDDQTSDPSHPPKALGAMTMPAMSSAKNTLPPDPWKLVDSPFGEMEQWRADALTIGGMGAYSDYMRDTIARFDQFRTDSISFVDALRRKEAEITARKDAVVAREQVITDLIGKAATLLDRINKRMGDAEKFAEEPATPPGDPRGADDNADDILPPDIIPPKEPEPTTDEELPPELAKLEPEEPAPSRGSAFPQPIAITLNSK